MKDRMVMQEVWERMEVPTADVMKIMQSAPERDDFQILLFSKIVPNLKKLGLLDAADGWLREKFTEMGAIAFEAAIRMKDRMVMQEVWERMEVPTSDVMQLMAAAPERDDFQILLFSKIVPNLKKLGLLDAADGWLRQKFTEMGAIAFENLTDSTEDEDAFADGSPAERNVA
jgi:hypothetical protein